MGISTSFHLTILNEDKKETVVSTTNPCDGVARMLYTGNPNYRTGFNIFSKISDEEAKLIRPTYTKDSESVLDEYEPFKPNIVEPWQLRSVLVKLRSELIRFLKEEIINSEGFDESKWSQDNKTIRETTWELISISEIIGALSIAEEQKSKVYLGLCDS
ncbi:hypothetical protein [Microbulbifer sp. JMSA002]|uniref:hypothetical protein n=1 Tax=Microbulbifer sp. JMSA002 TaxID=3243368 RepID=UPI004039E996